MGTLAEKWIAASAGADYGRRIVEEKGVCVEVSHSPLVGQDLFVLLFPRFSISFIQ